MKPGATFSPIVSGSIASGPVVKLNGSNNVTIDGSNDGSGSRNLTISNTSATASNILLIGSLGTTPISNVTVKNAILINGTNAASGIIMGDAGTLGNAGYFNNITVQNNSIQKAYIGLYIYSVVSAALNSTTITGNDLNTSGANSIRLVGVYAQGVNGLTVSNNNIGNFESASG